jgi:hypothetical protein
MAYSLIIKAPIIIIGPYVEETLFGKLEPVMVTGESQPPNRQEGALLLLDQFEKNELDITARI